MLERGLQLVNSPDQSNGGMQNKPEETPVSRRANSLAMLTIKLWLHEQDPAI